jgi:hypothetical protein
MKLRLFAMLVACCTMVAYAGETQDRAALAAEFKTSFERGTFAVLDERYSRALAHKERLGSGVFVASVMFQGASPSEPEEMMERMGIDAYFEPAERRAWSWMAKSPQSVAAAIALSKLYYLHGWAYRGSGFANSVSEEDFARFRSYMKLAQETLLAREGLGKTDPNWYSQMLAVGQVNGWTSEQYFAFAQAALDAFPDDYEIYFSVANRLLPQWGGSVEQLTGFAEYAAERTKATEGKSMYARIVWATYSGLGGAQRLKRGELDWPKLREGFDDIVKRYPVPWNLNFFASVACDAGDKATAQRVLGLIGDRVEPEAWANRGAYVRCKTLAAQ